MWLYVKSDRTHNLADGVDVLEMAFLADDGLAMQAVPVQDSP